jgi:hypothetical protein
LPGGTQSITKCILEFKAKSPAGCPGGTYSESRLTTFLFWIVLLLLLSLCFTLSYVYNYKQQNNLSGKDAIPNIDWKNSPNLDQDGLVLNDKLVRGN